MKVAIAGYSGLTGSFLYEKVLSDNKVDQIILAGRSKKDHANSKASFHKLGEGEYRCDAGFCLLGTTIGKAGSRENFRKVDLDMVVEFADACKKGGAKTFHLMSSIGADPSSSNFYLRTKGEAEEMVRALGFESLFIYRPSMLLGPRKEKRIGEMIGKVLFTALGFLLQGPLKKYRGIHVSKIASRMLQDSKHPQTGIHYRYYSDF